MSFRRTATVVPVLVAIVASVSPDTTVYVFATGCVDWWWPSFFFVVELCVVVDALES